MRFGRLDRRIDLQRKVVTLSPSGQPVESWSTLATRWASVNPVSGTERFSDPQIGASQQSEFQVRYSADIADLSPLDRLVYPSGSNSAVDIYDIISVSEIGRREGLRIIAVRRADT